MKYLIKGLGYLLLSVIGLLLLILIALQFISDDTYKKWLTGGVSSFTGRELAVHGDFALKLGTTISLLANDVRFENAEWAARKNMFTARRLYFQLNLLPLFRRQLELAFELNGSDLLLEINEDGTGNWQFNPGRPTEQEEKEPSPAPVEQPSEPFKLFITPLISNLEISDFILTHKAQKGTTQAVVELLQLSTQNGSIPLELKGIYQGAPVALQGSLGSTEAYLDNLEAPISLQGSFNDAEVEIQGSAGPLRPSPDFSLNVGLNIKDISALSPFVGTPIPELVNFQASAEAVAAGGKIRCDKIIISLDDPLVDLQVNGKIGDLLSLADIDLQTSLHTDHSNDLTMKLSLSPPFSLPKNIELTSSFTGSLEQLSVPELNLMAKDQGLSLHLDASIGNLITPEDAIADLSLHLETTELVGQYAGIDVPSFGPLDLNSRITSPGKTISVESITIKLADEALTADLGGTAEAITRSPDGSLEIAGINLGASAKSDRLQDIISRFDLELPVQLPKTFALEAAASGDTKELSLDSLTLSVIDDGVKATLSGSAKNVLSPGGVDIQLQASADDAPNLSAFVGRELPATGPLILTGNLLTASDNLNIKTFDLHFASNQLKANLKSSVANLAAFFSALQTNENYGAAGITATLAAEAPSIAKILELTGGLTVTNTMESQLGAMKLKAKVSSNDKLLQLDESELNLNGEGLKLEATGKVDDLITVSGVEASLQSDLDSLETLSPLLNKPLPATSPFSLSVEAQSDSLLSTPLSLSAQLQGEDIDTQLQATIPWLHEPQTLDATLHLKTESTSAFSNLLQKEIPAVGPFDLTAEASFAPGEYRLKRAQIHLDEGVVDGNLAYLAPPVDQDRKSLTGNFNLTNLDLTPFLTPEEQPPQEQITPAVPMEEETSDTKDISAGSKKRIFSDTPFSSRLLTQLDAALQVRAKSLTLSKGFSVNGNIDLNLDSGMLSIEPISINGETGGHGEGAITLDASQEVANIDVYLDFDEFVPPGRDGTFNLFIDLEGQGKSQAELFGSLNGHFVSSINDMTIKTSFLTEFGRGLLAKINPLVDKTSTTLECATVRFDAKDGLLDLHKKIAFQTTEVTWIGGGEIDLKEEEIDLGMTSKARKAMSSLTEVGLASLVHVGGTLADPKIGVDLKDVAKKYVGYTAFVATGGLSFLGQKLWDNRVANVNQCERILQGLEDH